MFNPVSLEAFEEKTGINYREFYGGWTEARRIVSPCDISQAIVVADMPLDYLGKILNSVTLIDQPDVFPFREKIFSTRRLDARALKVGQTFVMNRKILSLAHRTGVHAMFRPFTTISGTAKLNAKIILGKTAGGETVISHYLPPIVEAHQCGLRLLDGMHRFYIALGSGTTVESIIIEDITTPFPATPCCWDDVTPVDRKPSPEDCFFNFEPKLFRDIKSSGIDG